MLSIESRSINMAHSVVRILLLTDYEQEILNDTENANFSVSDAHKFNPITSISCFRLHIFQNIIPCLVWLLLCHCNCICVCRYICLSVFPNVFVFVFGWSGHVWHKGRALKVCSLSFLSLRLCEKVVWSCPMTCPGRTAARKISQKNWQHLLFEKRTQRKACTFWPFGWHRRRGRRHWQR